MTTKIIIVGSGPAGVSAAWPLVKSGIEVLMLEAGTKQLVARDQPCLQVFSHRAKNNRSGRLLLGKKLSCLESSFGLSPKIRATGNSSQVRDYIVKNKIFAKNFIPIGVHGSGGLSNFWGCVVDRFDDHDLVGWKIKQADLESSYASVAKRIGISGEKDSFMENSASYKGLHSKLSPSTNMSTLFDRHQKILSKNIDIRYSYNAVLSQTLDGRPGCEYGGSCMFGCTNGAAYNSSDELTSLKRFDNFKFKDGFLVEELIKTEFGWKVCYKNGEGTCNTLKASTVLLAAGTIASTKLILKHQGRFNSPVRLLTNPTMQCAFILPSRIGYPISEFNYAMPQLRIIDQSEEFSESLVGILSDGSHIPLPDLAAHVPFNLPGALSILGGLQSALQLGLIYFPGSFTENQICLKKCRDGNEKLEIIGKYNDGFEKFSRNRVGGIIKHMKKVGSYLLPGSLSLLKPGADAHYAGSLPMGEEVSVDGEVYNHENLFVVDGSILNSLPAKHLTYTIMANANRIAKKLVKRIYK